jgi:PilZ domain
MKTANRRESPRIDIKLRCHITSPALENAAVYTENISRSGLLIGWNGGEPIAVLPAIGQIVTVEIELPAHHGFGQKCIHCQGTVIRVAQPGADGAYVALRVNYMDFRSFHDRLRSLDTLEPVAQGWMA